MKFLSSVIVLMGFFVAATAGCYRSPDTTWYKPHVYKGAQDPLLGKLQEGGLHRQLDERFQAVQTDR